jgi:hypothetical protein
MASRTFITVIHILVIPSFFKFVPVVAAPVPVQEVRGACSDVADVADGGDDQVIVSGKRTEEGQDPSGYHGLTQASPGSRSMSVQLSTSPQDPPGSLSASDYASGVHQETTNPIQLPSSASCKIRRPPYASGGTELPWYSSGRGGVQMVRSGTSMRTKTDKWVPTTETEPASSSESSSQIIPRHRVRSSHHQIKSHLRHRARSSRCRSRKDSPDPYKASVQNVFLAI